MSPTKPTTEAAVQETPAETIRRQIDPHVVTRGRVVIIGLGGIGLFLSRALAAFLAGLRRALQPQQQITLLLVDGKMFSDWHTYRLDVPDFTNKAVAVAGELLERHECEGLNIRCFPEFVTPENVATVIREGDCVLMGVDNHATRNLVSRHCAGGQLRNVVLISAGNDGVEDGRQGSYGNTQIYIREDGVDRTAPLHKFHPEIANPADHSPAEAGCDETGAPQLTITNLFAAAVAASALLRLLISGGSDKQGIPQYDEVSFDVCRAVAQPHWLTAPPARPGKPD